MMTIVGIWYTHWKSHSFYPQLYILDYLVSNSFWQRLNPVWVFFTFVDDFLWGEDAYYIPIKSNIFTFLFIKSNILTTLYLSVASFYQGFMGHFSIEGSFTSTKFYFLINWNILSTTLFMNDNLITLNIHNQPFILC